jgi:hypothetical protein
MHIKKYFGKSKAEFDEESVKQHENILVRKGKDLVPPHMAAKFEETIHSIVRMGKKPNLHAIQDALDIIGALNNGDEKLINDAIG